jgi:tetratricopeptide (TPR) repeat protein
MRPDYAELDRFTGDRRGKTVEIRLLGPVGLFAAGHQLDIRPRQRLVVLAALAVDSGLVVAIDTLIGRVWEKPPKQDRRTLHSHISRLRGALREAAADDPDGSPARLVHRAAGYVLDVDRDSVDLFRFRRLAAQGRAATGDDDTAAALYRQAMELWRGEALAGLDGPWPESVRVGLAQERMGVERDQTDVRLRLGEHGQLVEGLSDAAAAHPLDERLAGQYMLALYRCGRQADALSHYEQVRKRLDNRVAVLSPPLRELRQRILGGDADLLRAPARTASGRPGTQAQVQQPPLKADRTLPADVPGFVGRREEMRHLLAAVDLAAAGPAQAIAIHAVDGMAGVGKTAFVVHAAHHLAPRFPDGQRFVDLRAHAPGQTPVAPVDALEILLQADGVAAAQVPAGLDARVGLWRERMAGKRMLLVLDDATDHAHVAPLLPAAPQCLVLITSRRKMATVPGVSLLALDTLPADDAITLFLHRAGARARRDDPAVARIVHLCGYLPLAITLTAARLHTHPTWTVADLAGDLADAHNRLDELASGALAVAAAFELSYRDLPAHRQRLFRRLGLHPGRGFDVFAAAALDDSTVPATRRGLEELLEHNLLTEPHRGRYRFHDLIAAHARSRATTDTQRDRDDATNRLLAYYQRAAADAGGQRAGTAPVDARAAGMPSLSDPQLATDWLTTERDNLVAATMVAAARHHPAAIAIPAALYEHLRHRGPFDLAIRLHDTAVAAARHAGDRTAEARALLNLAYMRCLASDYPSAVATAKTARDLCQQLGDVAGEAAALTTLATVSYMTGQYREATAAGERANSLHEHIGDRAGQAAALITLACVYFTTGDIPATAAAAGHSLILSQQVGDRRGQADALDALARVHRLTGDNVAAMAAAKQAQALFQEIGNRRGHANALQLLAHVQHATGDYATAATTAEQARSIYQQVGNRDGETFALRILARVHRDTGDHLTATATIKRASALSEQVGDRWGQASAAQILGTVRHVTGDLLAAAADFDRALGLFRGMGDPEGEAETLTCIGQLRFDTGAVTDARQQFAEALDIARRVRVPGHEARALEGIGRCLLQQGDLDGAVGHLNDSLSIYRRIHSPHTARVEAVLRGINSGECSTDQMNS